MVIVVYPMLSVKHCLNKDSNYVFLRNIITEMLKQRPDWYFIYPFPSNKGWFYEEDEEFWGHPNIIRIDMDLPTAKRDNVVHYDMKFWKKLMLEYGVDIIWTQTVEIGHNLPYIMGGFEKNGRTLVVNQHHYMIHDSMSYPVESQMNIMMNQILSARLVDLNVFNSDYTKKMLLDNVEKYWGNNFSMNDTVNKMGVLDKNLFRKFNVEDKNEIFTIHYNHRLIDVKKWQTTFDLLEELYEEGYKFKVVATGEGKRAKLNKYPFVEMKDDLYSYEDYIGELSKGHLNTTNTTIETFGIACIESTGLGGFLVAEDGITFPELVPHDYKYLFKNTTEQKEMIKQLITKWYDNPKEWIEEAQQLKDWTLETFSLEDYASRYIETFEGFNFNFAKTMKPQNRQYFVNVLKENNVKFEKLKDVEKMILNHHVGRQAFPIIKIKRILNEMGYKDYFFNGEQYIKWGGK